MNENLQLIVLDDHPMLKNGIKAILAIIDANSEGTSSKKLDIDLLREAIQTFSEESLPNHKLPQPGLSQGTYPHFPKNKFYRMEPSPDEITNRERDVLRLIVDEYTTEEIANLLHLSKRTVGTHRQNLLMKVGAKNTVGLVKYALRHGIVS